MPKTPSGEPKAKPAYNPLRGRPPSREVTCPECGHEFIPHKSKLLAKLILSEFPGSFSLAMAREKFSYYSYGSIRTRIAELVVERKLESLGAGRYRNLKRKTEE